MNNKPLNRHGAARRRFRSKGKQTKFAVGEVIPCDEVKCRFHHTIFVWQDIEEVGWMQYTGNRKSFWPCCLCVRYRKTDLLNTLVKKQEDTHES